MLELFIELLDQSIQAAKSDLRQRVEADSYLTREQEYVM